MAGGRKRKRAALKRGAAVDLPQQQRHQGAPGGAVQAGDDGAGPSAAAAAAAPLVVAKRLEVFTRQQIVAAALANDADMLQRALGMPDGDPRKAACYKRRATRPFKGCRPIDAAVIANAAAAIRVLTSVVDPNSAVREKFDGKGLRAAFPYLDLQQRTCAALRYGLTFGLSKGATPLCAALRLGHWEAAEALLDAGADVNLHEHRGTGDAPLMAIGNAPLESLDVLCDEAEAPWRTMLFRLLDGGADPLVPEPRPFLLHCDEKAGRACLDWMLAAPARGEALAPPAAAAALQAALQYRHTAAYPQLLELVRAAGPEEAPLAVEVALRLLAQAAQSGSEAAVRDAISLGASPADPAAIPLCLLGQAAVVTEPSQSWGALRALLAAGAQLRINDLLFAVDQRNAVAVHRLLEIGQPQAAPNAPHAQVVVCIHGRSPFATDHWDWLLSCPVLVNLEKAASTLERSLVTQAPYTLPYVMHDLRMGLDVAETLGAAGYRPTKYAGEDEEGPWHYDPLEDPEAGSRFAIEGGNRLMMVALDRPKLGPGTLQRFPRRLQAAVRVVLQAAHCGRTVVTDQLSVEQLSALCCWRRQQLYGTAQKQEQQQQQRRRPWGFARIDYELEHWATSRGGLAMGALLPSLRLAAEMERLEEHARHAQQRLEQVKHVFRDDLEPPSSAGDIRSLAALEQQLERRLARGSMQRPVLPTVPAPLSRLPADLVLKILWLAAYPLSAWAQAEDWGIELDSGESTSGGSSAGGGGGGGGDAGGGDGTPAPPDRPGGPYNPPDSPHYNHHAHPHYY